MEHLALQRVLSQLSKPLIIDVTGTMNSHPHATPSTLTNPPAQQPYPAYDVGYSITADVKTVRQTIPPKPANGQSSYHPYHMLTEGNLPAILFQLEPFPNSLRAVEVPLLVNEQTGQTETSERGRPLRYFSHIPRWVAVNVSGMLLELWLRLDARVEMADMLDRINVGGRKLPRPNAFNMRRMRFRDSINVPTFNPGRQQPTATEVELIGRLSREQILLNTAMAVDLPNNRLMKPILVNHGRLLGYVDSGLPLGYFLREFALPVPLPSDRQVVTLELRKRMQTLAQLRGCGNGVTDYSKLPFSLQPSWWNDRKKEIIQVQSITDIDDKTHEEFIQELLEQHPKTTRAGAPRATRPRQVVTAQTTNLSFQTHVPFPPPPPQASLRIPQPAAPSPALLFHQNYGPVVTSDETQSRAGSSMAIDPRLLATQGTNVLGDLLKADTMAQGTSQLAVTTAGSRTHYFVDNVYPAANEEEAATGPTHAVSVPGSVDLPDAADDASNDSNNNPNTNTNTNTNE